MSIESSSQEILEREFLLVRAKILEIAASLDRIGRAPGDAAQDGRLELLQTAIEKLLEESPKQNSERAKQIQLLFSRPYDKQWKTTLELSR